MAHMGEVGRKFRGLSPRAVETMLSRGREEACNEAGGPLQMYHYEIVDKQESETDIVVMCEFRVT